MLLCMSSACLPGLGQRVLCWMCHGRRPNPCPQTAKARSPGQESSSQPHPIPHWASPLGKGLAVFGCREVRGEKRPELWGCRKQLGAQNGAGVHRGWEAQVPEGKMRRQEGSSHGELRSSQLSAWPPVLPPRGPIPHTGVSSELSIAPSRAGQLCC